MLPSSHQYKRFPKEFCTENESQQNHERTDDFITQEKKIKGIRE
jgi:hypothetical protein